MADRRVKAQFERGNSFEIEIDGERIIAYEGETIAAALLAAGRRSFRYTIQKNQPRGFFCGIGLCHECMMVIDGVPNVRTCQTLAYPGARVATQKGFGTEEQCN